MSKTVRSRITKAKAPPPTESRVIPDNVTALALLIERADESLAKLEDHLDAVERRVDELETVVLALQGQVMDLDHSDSAPQTPEQAEQASGWLGKETRGEK